MNYETLRSRIKEVYRKLNAKNKSEAVMTARGMKLPRNRGFTPNELAQHYGGLKAPKSISFGPNITAGLKSGEIDVNEFGMSIVTSDLLDEVKIQMLGELAKSQGGNAAPKNVGRNDPCPCGSGKKYKKCCGK